MGLGVSRNTLLLSSGMLFLYSGFNSVTNVEQPVISSFQHGGGGDSSDQSRSFYGSGYLVLSVFNVFFAVFALVTPSALKILGAKASLLVCSAVFFLYAACLIYPVAGVVYSTAALTGICTSLLWATAFTVLSRSCDPDDLSVNSTVFWCLPQLSYIVGNCVIFLMFRNQPPGNQYISDQTRFLSMSIISGVTLGGLACFLLVDTSAVERGQQQPIRARLADSVGILGTISRNTVHVLSDGKFLPMTVIFVYTGIHCSRSLTRLPSLLTLSAFSDMFRHFSAR